VGKWKLASRTVHGTRATLRMSIPALLVSFGACVDSPNIPSERAEVPEGVSPYILPGVTGTACKTNYIDDGAGGCIYAPEADDTGTGSGGGTTGSPGTETQPGGTTSPTEEEEEDAIALTRVERDICPGCGERNPTPKERESIIAAMALVQCESMREVLQDRLSSMQVFTEQPSDLADPSNPDKVMGTHANGVIYIWAGMWRRDAQGNPIYDAQGRMILRNRSQFVKDVLVHEAAHAYWCYYQGYFDGSRTHHDKWRQTMSECGYPGTTG
jgi:hypothetical protein